MPPSPPPPPAPPPPVTAAGDAAALSSSDSNASSTARARDVARRRSPPPPPPPPPPSLPRRPRLAPSDTPSAALAATARPRSRCCKLAWLSAKSRTRRAASPPSMLLPPLATSAALHSRMARSTAATCACHCSVSSASATSVAAVTRASSARTSSANARSMSSCATGWGWGGTVGCDTADARVHMLIECYAPPAASTQRPPPRAAGAPWLPAAPHAPPPTQPAHSPALPPCVPPRLLPLPPCARPMSRRAARATPPAPHAPAHVLVRQALPRLCSGTGAGLCMITIAASVPNHTGVPHCTY